MPDFIYYSGNTSEPDWSNSTYYTAYQAYQEQEQAFNQMQELWEEQARQERELRDDKVNYPLFFLKEGIV